MIHVDIPGFGHLHIRNLVLDLNGTIAVDGRIIDGVSDRLGKLSENLDIHVLTADTFGRAASVLSDIPCKLHVLGNKSQDKEKMGFVKTLGKDTTASIGNGRNDRLMLEESALGIAVIQMEGAFVQTILSADIACSDILSALELFLFPLRLTATLRS